MVVDLQSNLHYFLRKSEAIAKELPRVQHCNKIRVLPNLFSHLGNLRSIGQRHQFVYMPLPKQANSMDKSIVWASFTMDNNNYDQSIIQHFLSKFKMYPDQVSLYKKYVSTQGGKKGKLKGHRHCACTGSTVAITVSLYTLAVHH